MLQAGDHVVHRSVADIGHRCRHGHGRFARGGDDIGGDAVEAKPQELRSGFTDGGRCCCRCDQQHQQAENDDDGPGCDGDPQQHPHVPEPQPFVRGSPDPSSGE